MLLGREFQDFDPATVKERPIYFQVRMVSGLEGNLQGVGLCKMFYWRVGAELMGRIASFYTIGIYFLIHLWDMGATIRPTFIALPSLPLEDS